MSTPPIRSAEAVRLPDLAAWTAAGRRIVMITAYDYPTAQMVDAAGVDVILVGDSAANVVLGYTSTVPVTVEEMLVLVRAVRRGARRPLVVADLPFGSYEASNEQAVGTAIQFVKDGGADAVKLERGGTTIERAKAIVDAGVPVIGHVGLTPQTAVNHGGYRARGRHAVDAIAITEAALALEAAGCSALVAEAIPAPVAGHIATLLTIPVIGIGAGAATDGQVLVLHDLLGLTPHDPPRFVRQYAQLRQPIIQAVTGYTDDVRNGHFPSGENGYSMPTDELDSYLAHASTPPASVRQSHPD